METHTKANRPCATNQKKQLDSIESSVKKFDFWKNDNKKLHFTLTPEELKKQFLHFIQFKSRIWIRRSYGAPAIAAFLIHELEATYDESQEKEITRLLTEVMYEKLKPYTQGIDPPSAN